MVYSKIQFSKKTDRPFFFTNFVATVDGKVQVTKDGEGYWPIGSETDFNTLLDLRASSDLLIHGKNTALGFNHLSRINSSEFRERRRNLGKGSDLQYLIISSHPDDSLLAFLKNDFGAKAYLVTTTTAILSKDLEKWVNIVRFGEQKVNLNELSEFLHEQGFENILMEGGPTLLGEFLAADLMDEIFLTIAPKIFGNQDKSTLTLVEGRLFPIEEVKNLKLISVNIVDDEVYLRYAINK